jgi:hypothetical protein
LAIARADLDRFRQGRFGRASGEYSPASVQEGGLNWRVSYHGGMSIPARWSILLAFAFLECSSSNVNDEQASGGSGGDAGSDAGSGGSSASGGSAGSSSGGASGVGAISGSGGAGPNTCSGNALACVTCCEGNQPDGYAEFFDEFKISQCSGQACSGTCGAICSGSSESVTQTCAECFFLNEPNVNQQVGLACKQSARVECQAFVSCLEACRLE